MFVLSHCAIKTNGQTTVQRAQRANHQHCPPDGAFDFLDFATPHAAAAAAAAEGGSVKGKEKQISNPAVCVVVLSHSQRMQREHALSLTLCLCSMWESKSLIGYIQLALAHFDDFLWPFGYFNVKQLVACNTLAFSLSLALSLACCLLLLLLMFCCYHVNERWLGKGGMCAVIRSLTCSLSNIS